LVSLTSLAWRGVHVTCPAATEWYPIKHADLYSDSVGVNQSFTRVRRNTRASVPLCRACLTRRAIETAIHARILMAEDNAVNQEVIVAILDRLSDAATLVPNG
jgi:hypothetical protein